MSEWSRNRSNTIRFPSRVMSKVVMVPEYPRRAHISESSERTNVLVGTGCGRAA